MQNAKCNHTMEAIEREPIRLERTVTGLGMVYGYGCNHGFKLHAVLAYPGGIEVLITESEFGNDYVFPGKVRLFAFWFETALP